MSEKSLNKTKVVIAGGGPTGCEIAQTLSRLNKNLSITIISPEILGAEDIIARKVACKI